MILSEFDIIEKFFSQQPLRREDVILGIGDDCAIVSPPQGQQIAITTDTLLPGVHFPLTTSAYDIGFKSLAVNLSDLAAMSATPTWLTLALTLPHIDEQWLKDFSRGFFDLANRHQVQLIGGDLTQGPLTITIQAQGIVSKDQILKRSTAKIGDLIYVTNSIGDAAIGLSLSQKKFSVPTHLQSYFLRRLNRPEPRVEMGKQLGNLATAAIDISDGLAADLGHILEKSHVGAVVYVDELPFSRELLESVSLEQAIRFALNGGDDYELCFTISPEKQAELSSQCTCIGVISKNPGLDLRYRNGNPYTGSIKGYQHFLSP